MYGYDYQQRETILYLKSLDNPFMGCTTVTYKGTREAVGDDSRTDFLCNYALPLRP